MSLPFLGKDKAEIRVLCLLRARISSSAPPGALGTDPVSYRLCRRQVGSELGIEGVRDRAQAPTQSASSDFTQTRLAFIGCVYRAICKVHLKKDSPTKGWGGGGALP